MIKKNILYRLFAYLVVAMAVIGSGYIALAGESEYSDWLKVNLGGDEVLLCDRKIDSDYFFIAKKGTEIKVGSLIDVDRSGDAPKNFIISWEFIDQNNNYLELRVLPRDVKQNYIKHEGKLYAENVSYRSLPLEGVTELFISIELAKYENKSNMPKSLSELEERGGIDKIFICSVRDPIRL